MTDNPHKACPFEDCGSSDAFNWNDDGYGFCHSCGESYPAKKSVATFDWAAHAYPVKERVNIMNVPVSGSTFNNIRGLKPDVWRGRADDKKQGSVGAVESVPVGAFKVQGYCLAAYQDLLSSGICPEQARMILPQNMMTEWYWSGTLGAFAKMCNLRCKPDTQLETRIVGNEVSNIMLRYFPVSWEALKSDY